MPEYTLRNVDPQLWSQFTDRANREGWPIRALIVGLLEAYARGEFTPTAPPPRELPEFAWLRAHYRDVAQTPDFGALNTATQWEQLVEHVLDSPAAMHWQQLDEVPPAQRREILRWLRQTSDLPSRQILTLRAIAHIGEGPTLRTKRRAFQYEVLGLPADQQAWIADFDGGWRILRVVDGVQGHWGGPHLTKEDALDTLARTLGKPDPPASLVDVTMLPQWIIGGSDFHLCRTENDAPDRAAHVPIPNETYVKWSDIQAAREGKAHS
jgi:hypothetical protein